MDLKSIKIARNSLKDAKGIFLRDQTNNTYLLTHELCSMMWLDDDETVIMLYKNPDFYTNNERVYPMMCSVMSYSEILNITGIFSYQSAKDLLTANKDKMDEKLYKLSLDEINNKIKEL